MATVTDVDSTRLSRLTHIDALLNDGPGWNWLSPTRNAINYTFSVASSNETGNDQISGGVIAFNAVQQAAVKGLLSYISSFTGLVFTPTTDGKIGRAHV